MFARMNTFNGPPEGLDGLTRVAEEKVLPAADRLPGFRGMLVLGDRATGKSISITLWETEEAMLASEQAANKLRQEANTAGGTQTAAVERFEVLLDRSR